jgi:hypothetical protein
MVSVAELVYGKPLRIPGELLTPTADPLDPVHLTTELRHHMACLRPVPAARHASPATFVHSDLENWTHVYVRQDTRTGLWSLFIQRPLPILVTERDDIATRARESHHGVNLQGQAGLRSQLD